LLALIVGLWIALTDQQLPEPVPVAAPARVFAAERAFADVNLLAASPHPIGSPQNTQVRDALIARMTELGLSPQIRAGVGVQPSRYAAERLAAGYVENIVGILPGRDRRGKAVALMAHYDSVKASPGAADDIMGVAGDPGNRTRPEGARNPGAGRHGDLHRRRGSRAAGCQSLLPARSVGAADRPDPERRGTWWWRARSDVSDQPAE